MAQSKYKVNQSIEVTYQAPNSTSGLLAVTMEIFDETHAKDAVNFPDVIMTEIAATGRYYGAFTPDVEGRWNVHINDGTGGGKVVKQFAVAGYDIDSVGDAVGVMDGKVDTVDAKVTALNDVSTAQVNTEVDTALADYDAPTKAELDASEGNVRGADNDTLKDISDQIDSIDPSAGAMLG